MSRLSLQGQRQAIGTAIEQQKALAAGNSFRPNRNQAVDKLQLEHLIEVERTVVWLARHRDAVVAAEREITGLSQALSGPLDPAPVIADIVRVVAELPDRTSPEDRPDMMLVTGDELAAIVEDHLKGYLAGLAAAHMPAVIGGRRR